MTDRVVGPLREFRAPLHDGLRQLQLAAEAVGGAEPRVALAALDAAVSFLSDHFVPIAKAEEYTFYIAVDGIIGAVGASQVMVAQHDSIAAMVRDLAQVIAAAHTDDDPAAYARYLLPLLYGLYAVIRAHLEAEDDVYLTLLDEALSESQVDMIVKNIGRITAARAGHEAPV